MEFLVTILNLTAGMYKNGQLPEMPDCKPWVEDGYWEIKRSNNAIVEEAYKQFNGKKCILAVRNRCNTLYQRYMFRDNLLIINNHLLKSPHLLSVNRCSSWMQASKQQSSCCHLPDREDFRRKKSTKAVCRLIVKIRLIDNYLFICWITYLPYAVFLVKCQNI